MLVLSLVLLATVAYCQVPVPCITPPQWEVSKRLLYLGLLFRSLTSHYFERT